MRARTAAIEDESEGYFASISDLMVGVLFVFLLMLTVFAINFRDAELEQTDKLRDLEAARAALVEEQIRAEGARRFAEQERIRAEAATARAEELVRLLRRAQAELANAIEGRQRKREILLRTLQSQLEDRGVAVQIDTNAGILRLPSDLLFPVGASELQTGTRGRKGPRERVADVADVLAEVLPCQVANSGGRCNGAYFPLLETVLIEGHTDRQPYQGVTPQESQQRNLNLSAQRALSVAREVLTRQPALDDLANGEQLRILGIAGYGDRRPLIDARGDTESDYQRNRRIDLRFVLTATTTDELRRLQREIDQLLSQAQ